MAESFPIPFGRYQLVERLAVGGMAELFKAQVSGAHGFTKNVVIKRILPHLAADDHFNTMFIDEAKITARLSHPKIAQTLELGKFNGQLYIAMEYVDGLDALAMLRECAHRRARIPLHIAVFIIQEVLDALDFAHNQTGADGEVLHIVHRDVSPSNILVSRRGDVKLVDFGIAQATERENTTKGGTLKGKYGYMAPEQVVGAALDARSDLFSAAIVLAEMAMGRRLFTSPNELDVLLMVRDVRLDRLAKYGKALDPDLDVILRKALQKEPDDRFQSCAEFREALSEWLFEKRFRVSARDVGALVNELYADAWKRKRKSGIKPPSLPQKAAEAIAAVAAATGAPAAPKEPPAPPPRPRRPADAHAVTDAAIAQPGAGTPDATAPDEPALTAEQQFPSSASVEEAIAMVAGEHAVKERGRDVGFAIDIELSPDVESIDIDLDDDGPPDGSVDLAALVADYDLGDLGDELEGPVTGTAEHEAPSMETSASFSSLSAADDSNEIERSPTTQEIAFDDIVAAIEDAIPKDELGKPLQPTPEQAAAARASKPNLEDVDGEPDDRGDLVGTPALRVLARLATARASGLLIVEIGGTRKEIYYKDGRPEYVSSNVASELFGEYLVGQKVISDGELSMALAMMPHYGGKLGDTLVGLGLMKPLDVFRQLTRQVRDKLIDVCTWSKGSFRWFDSREYKREAFPLDLDAFEVLGAGAMATPMARIDAWLGDVRDKCLRAVNRPRIQPESFQLGDEVRGVYNSLDGARTVAELEARYTDRIRRDRFVRILYLIVMTELACEV